MTSVILNHVQSALQVSALLPISALINYLRQPSSEEESTSTYQDTTVVLKVSGRARDLSRRGELRRAAPR